MVDYESVQAYQQEMRAFAERQRHAAQARGSGPRRPDLRGLLAAGLARAAEALPGTRRAKPAYCRGGTA